jgi:enterochelin esterase family protein
MTTPMTDLASTPILPAVESLVADAIAGPSPAFAGGLRALFAHDPHATTGADPVPTVTTLVWGEDVVVIAAADRQPELFLDDPTPIAMRPVAGERYWIHTTRLGADRTYDYAVHVEGKPITSSLSPLSTAALGPLSHPLPDVPRGVLSDRQTLTSEIYDGAEVEYWTYTTPGIDTERGAPLMVWLDGRFFLGLSDALNVRLQTVTDNLVHRGLIPPMVHLLMSPAVGGTREIDPESFHTRFTDFRISQYDEVSDEFVRHLVEEVLPEVERSVKIRADGYSRGIAGGSSGGTAAFKVGWYAPDQFSRLYPINASFTAWGWRPGDGIEGGQALPLRVRGEERKNLRVWLSTGAHDDFDVEVADHLAFSWEGVGELRPALHRAGSQVLGNLEMAQALKTSGYDFHFRFGRSGHTTSQVALELPESLAWLWRDYDAARTAQTYEQERAEREKPAYRFGVINRDTW